MENLLFSYGTLQSESVQLSLFGRVLTGLPDCLYGYELQRIEIKNMSVVKTSGKKHHDIAVLNKEYVPGITGTVYEITENELALCDQYEVADYTRISAILESGKTAWVYVRI